jgi:hypothetical protein
MLTALGVHDRFGQGEAEVLDDPERSRDDPELGADLAVQGRQIPMYQPCPSLVGVELADDRDAQVVEAAQVVCDHAAVPDLVAQ